LLVTVNNRLKFEIEIVHDLSCHLILNTAHTVELAAAIILADAIVTPPSPKWPKNVSSWT